MFNHPARRLMREIIFVFGYLLITLLLITLFTYSPDDPGWSVADGNRDTIHNQFGIVGAYIADVLLASLGYSAFMLCLIGLISLHALLRPATRAYVEKLGGYWFALGWVLFILSSSSLERLRFSQYHELLPSGSGGGVGALVSDSMVNLFGYTGASLIMLFVWIISWSLAANMSWFSFCEIIGGRLEKFALWFYDRYKQRRNAIEAIQGRQQRDKVFLASHAKPQMQLTPPEKKITIPKPPQPPHDRVKQQTSIPSDSPIPPILKSAEKKPPSPIPPTAQPSDKPATLPSSSLLDTYQDTSQNASDEAIQQNSTLIEETLESFGVSAKVLSVNPGPVITRYDIQPATGVRGAQIVSLVRDMARALTVPSIRVLETIPGQNCMGLEIPNQNRATVYFSDLVNDSSYINVHHKLPLALGKDATGKPTTIDLSTMPHLLVAGATGSGKSVCINAMLLSLLFASPPDKLRLILIDPKMLELASYHDIPHLLAPVVTDVNLSPVALNWALEEMENRYRIMSQSGVRNIDSYNRYLQKQNTPATDSESPSPMPHIVIVIDELADLMMTTGKKVEVSICRLAQKARAAGIHLILATQRPSVDVITGLIKANIPCRIAFQVASKIDSRTIIDQMGAEALLGMGDMLYLPSGANAPIRIHGAFVSDDEVKRVADHLRVSGTPDYAVDFASPQTIAQSNGQDFNAESDELYDQAVEAVLSASRPSISFVQRKLRIGYNRAARLIETMEQAGIVSSMDENGVRKVIAPRAMPEQ